MSSSSSSSIDTSGEGHVPSEVSLGSLEGPSASFLQPEIVSSEFIRFQSNNSRNFIWESNKGSANGPTSTDRVNRSNAQDDFEFTRKRGDGGGGGGGSLNSKSVQSFRAKSWELWWLQSQLWNRGLVLLLVIFIVTAFLQLNIGLYFFANSFVHKVQDPQICKTEKCRKMSAWLNQSMDTSVSPCEDFLQFMCGNHKETDIGNLPFEWYDSFARLEADGESILALLLKKSESEDPIWKQMLKYYHACVDLPKRERSGLTVFSKIITEIFEDFDFWDDTKEPRLEVIASRVVEIVGDYGLFSIGEPLHYFFVFYNPVQSSQSITNLTSTKLNTILPFIFDGLGIPRNKRSEIKTDVLHMMATLNFLIYQKQPEELTPCDNNILNYKHYFDLNVPFWNVYIGNDSMEPVPGTNNKRWKLKDGENFVFDLFTAYTNRPSNYEARFDRLFTCWNSLMQKIPVEHIRAVYATFWSLRILTEIGDEIDEKTLTRHQLHESQIITDTQKRNIKRSIYAQCFESIQHQMGYLPIFSLFKRHQQDDNIFNFEQVNKIINESATGILRWYLPPEEGGLPLVSSFYRERVENILSGRADTSILIPHREDDYSFHQREEDENEIESTDEHLRNVIIWKRYTLNRMVHFWKKGTPQGRLVWYRDFYELEKVDAFPFPGYSAYGILKFPISLFLFPYWNNDILAANFAGTYYLAAKAWLKLVYFDHHEENVNENILYNSKIKQPYMEGTFSDGDYENCETYYTGERGLSTPHCFAFNFGFRKTNRDSNIYASGVSHTYYISITIKTALRMYIEEKKRLETELYSTLSPTQKAHTRFNRLIGFEKYSDGMLFFMTIGRHFCRSRADTDEYKHHVNQFMASFMAMEEFGDHWGCPPGSVMNPLKKCYGAV